MKQVCQSCGMPIKNDDQLANEADGQKSKYCVMCYKNGEFLLPDITVEEMRNLCVDLMNKEMHIPKFLGRKMTESLYGLERWK